MPSGENSTADSLTKMQMTLAEAAILQSRRNADANLERAQRAAWGENYRPSDRASGEEMILVDSTVTITNNGATPATASPESRSQCRTDPALPTKTPAGRSAGTLAKLALGAALTASGAGAGLGIPLLFSGGKDVVEAVSEKAAATKTDARPGSGWTLELGGGR